MRIKLVSVASVKNENCKLVNAVISLLRTLCSYEYRKAFHGNLLKRASGNFVQY